MTKSNEDNYKELTQFMHYLQATVDLPLVLVADGSSNLYWWINVSFAVHPNMNGHTGSTLSMGKGFVYSMSSTQKLVSWSSTELELVGVHDVLLQILWTTYFLHGQGFGVEDNIVYQDNKSSILLEKNGHASSSKHTHHIQLQYFFVKDLVDKKLVCIKYCLTRIMHGDYFTKHL